MVQLRVNGFGASNDDFVSGTLGNGAGWIIQSAVYDGTELVHEVNGLEIDRFTHSYNTRVGPVVLGADLDQSPYVQMQVAAVLMYDRALSEAEQAELESYIASKYNVEGVGSPVAQADEIEIGVGSEISIDALANACGR